jgi:hypothetical protein
MSIPPPIYFVWHPTPEGHVMVPRGSRNSRLADQSFTSRETYRMIVDAERSIESHRHYFACVREAWNNLPEHLADEFPTDERLRKWVLIRTGFCQHTRMVMKSHAEAICTAGDLQRRDSCAVLEINGNVINWYTAKSQRLGPGGMSRSEFQRSKTAVLDYLAKMLETTPEELAAAGKRAA